MQSIARSGLLILLALVGAACSDSTGTEFQVFLVTDTVEVYAPTLPRNVGLPTAVDITVNPNGGVQGARHPERDALEWDFAVRIRDGELVLIPPRGIGATSSTAALTRAIAGAVFDSLDVAPSQSTFLADSAVVMRSGDVYVARSRDVPCVFSGVGSYFAKIQPLEVDVAEGRLRFRIVTNEQCGDPRLVPLE